MARSSVYLIFMYVLSTLWWAPSARAQSCDANRYAKIRQYENWIDTDLEPADTDVAQLVSTLKKYSKTSKRLARQILALIESASSKMLKEYIVEIGVAPADVDLILEYYSRWRCERYGAQIMKLAYQSEDEQVNHGKKISKAGRAIMASAYNSCDVLKSPELRRSDSTLQGIEVVGTHPYAPNVDIFAITDKDAFLKSHFYYKSIKSKTQQCSGEKPEDPLFYRFGGKPAAVDRRSNFTLRRSEGSGGKHLGIDCSGFVLAALYATGARTSENSAINTDTFQLVPARKFKNPRPEGLSCLVPISPLNSVQGLLIGDLIATDWHIVIVDEISQYKNQPDPFGYRKYGPSFNCNKLQISDFDFKLIQSSATLMIGLNRMHIREFLNSEIKEIAQMADDLLNYAKWTCAVQLKQLDRTQILKEKLEKLSTQVVRHSSHPSCQQAPLHYEGEQCGSSCEKK